MDGRGRATDNIFIERLWRATKRDYVYICPANNGTELYKGLETFFDYYNNKKTHQGIERCIPASNLQKSGVICRFAPCVYFKVWV